MSGKQRRELAEAAVKAGEFQRGLVLRLSSDFRDKLAAEGVIFTRVDRGEFVKSCEVYYTYPEFSSWTPGLRGTVMDILAK